MKNTMEDFYEYEPYELAAQDKKRLLLDRVNSLTDMHYKSCPEYSMILDKVYGKKSDSKTDGSAPKTDTDDKQCISDLRVFDFKAESIAKVPFLPVSLFKRMELKSISDSEVFKTMTSSGTTGQQVSKIFLDKDTSKLQQKVLVEIVKSFTGSSRSPMIILDCPSVIKDRAKFSARGAGILGFSIFGSKKIYAFDDDMRLDVEGIKGFLDEHSGETVFLFGFTFMIWEYFYKELRKLCDEGGYAGEYPINLKNGVLIHGGGWKKLINEAVSKQEFKDCLKAVCGIESVHDYYGMVEQTGCIYMECECGHLHASIYSDVLTRRMKDFSVCDFGEEGVIEVVSSIAQSYPGHVILTEDVGVILGEDDCPCGRKGKYFTVSGRMAKAEVRGCSDTFEKK